MYMCWDKPWLGAKGLFIFFDILDDSIICNDRVFLLGDANGQSSHKRNVT